MTPNLRATIAALVLTAAALVAWLAFGKSAAVTPDESGAESPAPQAGAPPTLSAPTRRAARKAEEARRPEAADGVRDEPSMPAPDAETVVGTTVDPEGRPVGGIGLAVVWGGGDRGLSSDLSLFRTEGADVRAPWAAERDGPTAGADGAFRVRAPDFRPDVQMVVPTDVAWMARRPSRGTDGRTTVVLDPAAWVVVRVVDEGGKPVPKFDARVADLRSGVSDWGFVATGGGFVSQFRRSPGLPATVDAAVVAARDGRVAARDVRIPAGQSSAEVTLTLRRSGGMGLLVLSVIDAPAALRARPVEVEIRLLAHPSLVAERRPAKWADDHASISVEVPEGGWTLRVRPSDGNEHVPYWERTVTVSSGLESRFTWTP